MVKVSQIALTSIMAVALGFLSPEIALAAPPVKPSLAASNMLHHVPTGRDPFNSTQADTTEGFVQLLRSNDALRTRYARHFGVSQSDVVDFVRNALIPYTLPAPRTMTTFGVTRTGMIYPVTTHLKKGTKVWATREGVPVLKWTCSNPLSYTLPGSKLKKKPVRQEAYLPARTPGLVAAQEANQVDGVGSAFTSRNVTEEQIAGNIMEPTVPLTTAMTVASTDIGGPLVNAAVPPLKTGGGGWLTPFIPAVPLLFPPKGSTSVIAPAAVPESATMILFGSGFLPLLSLMVLRRKLSR